MKKILVIYFISFVIWSCGGGEDSGTTNPTNPTTPNNPSTGIPNTAPTTPNLASPTNGKLCINNTVDFQWEAATDAEKDAISYQIQIATDNLFTKIIKTVEGSSTSQTIALEKGIAYYWRVKAVDSKNLSGSYSTTFNFYTEAVVQANHLPFLPEIVAPGFSASINAGTTTLKWSATDTDVSDVLTYDVYFGLDTPPTAKVIDNKTSTSVDVTTIALKRYYWKVVVKDNKGGQTIGQIWNFKTN
ncbi:MAG: hypothetical protein KA210_01835 [Bacteroidia bacterium]|nr:hypothetical protein [Bacteroidia bacterium]